MMLTTAKRQTSALGPRQYIANPWLSEVRSPYSVSCLFGDKLFVVGC